MLLAAEGSYIYRRLLERDPFQCSVERARATGRRYEAQICTILLLVECSFRWRPGCLSGVEARLVECKHMSKNHIRYECIYTEYKSAIYNLCKLK